MLAAFAHMHEHKVAYRNLRHEKLVETIKIELAKLIKNGRTYTFRWTLDYLAPVIMTGTIGPWIIGGGGVVLRHD